MRDQRTAPLDDLLSFWVYSSDGVNATGRRRLAEIAAHNRVRPAPIERVSSPKNVKVGGYFDWTGDVVSFSRHAWSEGASINQIWAGRSKTVLRILHPRRGFEIDYDSLIVPVGRRGELETLITGRYEVTSVTKTDDGLTIIDLAEN